MQIGGYSIEIDDDPGRVLPVYRCLEVFDNRGIDSDNPLAHLWLRIHPEY